MYIFSLFSTACSTKKSKDEGVGGGRGAASRHGAWGVSEGGCVPVLSHLVLRLYVSVWPKPRAGRRRRTPSRLFHAVSEGDTSVTCACAPRCHLWKRSPALNHTFTWCTAWRVQELVRGTVLNMLRLLQMLRRWDEALGNVVTSHSFNC